MSMPCVAQPSSTAPSSTVQPDTVELGAATKTAFQRVSSPDENQAKTITVPEAANGSIFRTSGK